MSAILDELNRQYPGPEHDIERQMAASSHLVRMERIIQCGDELMALQRQTISFLADTVQELLTGFSSLPLPCDLKDKCVSISQKVSQIKANAS